jgi:hypothetical protein
VWTIRVLRRESIAFMSVVWLAGHFDYETYTLRRALWDIGIREVRSGIHETTPGVEKAEMGRQGAAFIDHRIPRHRLVSWKFTVRP